jgi:hypothetical protein
VQSDSILELSPHSYQVRWSEHTRATPPRSPGHADAARRKIQSASGLIPGDLERGWAPPLPNVIEQLAQVLELDRDLLCLAARQVPPEVAEELKHLSRSNGPRGVASVQAWDGGR